MEEACVARAQVDDALLEQVHERLVEGLHPVVLAFTDHLQDVGAAGRVDDGLLDAPVDDHDLEGGHTAGRRLYVGTSRWQIVPLRAPASVMRAWRCWFGGKKSTTRLIVSTASTVCKRREDEVSGLGGRQRSPDGLGVAHLADEDDVGVLAQRRAQGDQETLGIETDLALADGSHLVPVEDLDRVLDRDDVALSRCG